MKETFLSKTFSDLIKKDLETEQPENIGISDNEPLPTNVLPFPGE